MNRPYNTGASPWGCQRAHTCSATPPGWRPAQRRARPHRGRLEPPRLSARMAARRGVRSKTAEVQESCGVFLLWPRAAHGTADLPQPPHATRSTKPCPHNVDRQPSAPVIPCARTRRIRRGAVSVFLRAAPGSTPTRRQRYAPPTCRTTPGPTSFLLFPFCRSLPGLLCRAVPGSVGPCAAAARRHGVGSRRLPQ